MAVSATTSWRTFFIWIGFTKGSIKQANTINNFIQRITTDINNNTRLTKLWDLRDTRYMEYSMLKNIIKQNKFISQTPRNNILVKLEGFQGVLRSHDPERHSALEWPMKKITVGIYNSVIVMCSFSAAISKLFKLYIFARKGLDIYKKWRIHLSSLALNYLIIWPI